MPIQQRVPHSKAQGGQVWVDPSRDIAHAFPNYVRRALEVAEHDINAADMDSNTKQSCINGLQQDAKVMANFIKASYGEGRKEMVQDAVRHSGLAARDSVSPVFMRAFLKVLASAYWTGLGFALHGGGERPVDTELVDQYIKKE